jgi:hypothetical protein
VRISAVVDVLGSGSAIASALEDADKRLPNRFHDRKCCDIRKEQGFEFEWLNVREKAVRPTATRGDDLLHECIFHKSTSLPRVPNAASVLHAREVTKQPVQVKQRRDICIATLAKRVAQEPHDALARQPATSTVL